MINVYTITQRYHYLVNVLDFRTKVLICRVNIWSLIHSGALLRGKWDCISNYIRATGITWVCPGWVRICGPPTGMNYAYSSEVTTHSEWMLSCFWDRFLLIGLIEVKWSPMFLSSPRTFTREADTWLENMLV